MYIMKLGLAIVVETLDTRTNLGAEALPDDAEEVGLGRVVHRQGDSLLREQEDRAAHDKEENALDGWRVGG